MASGGLTPTEQRVAVAVGPARTTLWTSLRFESAGRAGRRRGAGAAGLGSIDLSSDAWMEALEVATAPRIFPPPDANPFCPGERSGSPTVFSVAGQIGHTASLPPQDVTVLDDVAAVSSWAAQDNLVISPSLLAGLGALSGVRFVGVRFTAPSGASVTPTLRVAMPGAPPALPLALTGAAGAGLRVTAWILGQGEASLVGATQVATAPGSLVWKAGAQASNYDALTGSAPGRRRRGHLPRRGHQPREPLAERLHRPGHGLHRRRGDHLLRARRRHYGDGSFDSSTCIAAASPALESTATVAAVCPHAAYGLVDSTATCTGVSGAEGQIDPSALRCGAPARTDLAAGALRPHARPRPG